MRILRSRCTRAIHPSVALAMLAGLGATVLAPGVARATNILEFPDNGSEQMARGGAWMARASDPLAAFYNPAGLAGQQTRLTLQANISVENTCFTRQLAKNDPTIEPLAGANGAFPKVCNGGSPSPDPQLGLTYRLTPKIGLGFLPLLAPSAPAANNSWPMFVKDQPAPQRYMLVSSNLLLITPTIAAGFEVVDRLRLGASFQWGIATFDYKSATAATNGAAVTGGTVDPKSNDVLAEATGKQVFVPGFTLGAIWSPLDDLDIAGWYKYSAPVSTDADLKAAPGAFSGAAALGKTPTLNNVNGPQGQTNIGQVKLVLPMEAKVGFRFHVPRAGVAYDEHTRDPLSQDKFDAEVNLTYANNSAANTLQVRFPGNANGDGTVPVPGTPGYAPPISDVNHGYKDVYGVRVGGDYNAIPDKLAVRAGAFFESNGQNPTYMNIDNVGSQKIGLALGGTYRIHFGGEGKTRALEISLGYMHVFYADETNNGPGGLPAIAGTACNPVESPEPAGTTCANGTPKNRTNWPINLGTITNSVNVFNVGLSYRF